MLITVHLRRRGWSSSSIASEGPSQAAVLIFTGSLHLSMLRKGTECHRQILASYLQGLELAANDHVVVFDLLPNR